MLRVVSLELGAHDVAELNDDWISDRIHREQPLATHRHHAGLAEDGEVFGHVGLAGAGGFHELGHAVLALHEGVEQSQAHGLGERAEPGGDHGQGGVGERLGFGGFLGGHEIHETCTSEGAWHGFCEVDQVKRICVPSPADSS